MTDLERLWSHVDVRGPDDCWLWTASTDSGGYGLVWWPSATAARGGSMQGAHRVVYEATTGPVPDGLDVMHSCDTPPCCNPRHLRAGTRGDNMADCAAKGRAPRDERHSSAKLTAEQYAELRRRRADGEPLRSLAAAFDVSPSTVHRIAHRERPA